jgi:hypothetical protein
MSFVWTTSRPCNISEQALLGCFRQPSGLAKPLHAELKQLFAISGVWVRNVGDRHDTTRQILQIIRRIVPRLKV